MNVAVLSSGRVLNRSAKDVLGADATPQDSEDPLLIKSLVGVDLASP